MADDRAFLHMVLELALAEVRAAHKDYLGVPHLFMALTRLEGGCTQDALQRLGYAPEQIHEAFCLALGKGKASAETPILPTRSSRDVLLRAEQLTTVTAGEAFVDERAVVQVILEGKEGVTHELLAKQGIDPAQLLEQIRASEAHTALESLTSEELHSLEEAIHLNPDDPSARNEKGNAIRKLDRSDEGSMPSPAQSRTFLRAVLELALTEVRAAHKDYLGVPHLFMALVRLEGGCTQDALQRLGSSPRQVYEAFCQALGKGKASAETPILPTRSARDVLLRAEELATIIDGEKFVDERAVAQALLEGKEGATHELLAKQGVDPDRLLEQIRASRAHAALESAAIAHEDLTIFLTPPNDDSASN
jgi:ATP-dependent Clp protease ATP-binding subunit ClpA